MLNVAEFEQLSERIKEDLEKTREESTVLGRSVVRIDLGRLLELMQ